MAPRFRISWGVPALVVDFVGECATNHGANYFFAIELSGGAGDDQFAIAQNRDSIGLGQGFFECMGDEYDGNAGALQALHQRKKMTLFLGSKCRGRLVEDDDLGLVMDSAGDLDHLSLGRSERSDGRSGIYSEVERLQKLLCGNVNAAQPIEEFLFAKVDVLSNRHRGNEARLLVNHGDAVV